MSRERDLLDKKWGNCQEKGTHCHINVTWTVTVNTGIRKCWLPVTCFYTLRMDYVKKKEKHIWITWIKLHFLKTNSQSFNTSTSVSKKRMVVIFFFIWGLTPIFLLNILKGKRGGKSYGCLKDTCFSHHAVYEPGGTLHFTRYLVNVMKPCISRQTFPDPIPPLTCKPERLLTLSLHIFKFQTERQPIKLWLHR